MSTIGYFVTGVGIAGFLYTFHLVSGRVAWAYRHYPDADNVAGGIFVGICAAALWPIVLPPMLVLTYASGGIATLRYLMVERLMWSPDPKAEIVRQRR